MKKRCKFVMAWMEYQEVFFDTNDIFSNAFGIQLMISYVPGPTYQNPNLK